MKKQTVSKLEISLSIAIESWWDNLQDSDDIDWGDMPLVGEEVFEIMATAATSVLRGMHDTQKHLQDEGMLKS